MAEVRDELRAVGDAVEAPAPPRVDECATGAARARGGRRGDRAQVATRPRPRARVAAELRSQGFRRGLLAGTFVFLLRGRGPGLLRPAAVGRATRGRAGRTGIAARPRRPRPRAAGRTGAGRGPAGRREASAGAEKKAQERASRRRAARRARGRRGRHRRGRAAEARRQYGIAAKIDPANAAARRGLERAETLDAVRTLLAAGGGIRAQRPAAGRRAGLAQGARARSGTPRPRERAGEGPGAGRRPAHSPPRLPTRSRRCRARTIAAARTAYERAGRIRPGAPEVKEGLEQVQRALGDRTIARAPRLRRARPSARSAGATRSRSIVRRSRSTRSCSTRSRASSAWSRASCSTPRSPRIVERPERLFSSEVRGAARATLAQAAAMPDPGPVLSRQVDRARGRCSPRRRRRCAS